jgi:hypothetical protein
VAVLVAVGSYGVLNLSETSTNSSSTAASPIQQGTSTLSSNGGRQPSYLLDLFGNFSSMTVADVVNNPDESMTAENVTYAVLGSTQVNSTSYPRVAFTVAGGSTTTLWFDQRGNVSLAEVEGGGNYTGTLAGIQGGFLTSYFSFTSVESNATLLSGLQRTGGALQEIGPTQMSVSTYELSASNTSALAVMAVKIATIPGTDVRLLVYFDQIPANPDGITELFQVTSLSRA